jgi:stage II sporulation protein M
MVIFEGLRIRLEDFLDEHKGAVLLLVALFVIGVVFGALAVRSLEVNDRLDIVQYLGTNLVRMEHPDEGTQQIVMWRALSGNAEVVLLFWVLGISVVGVVGVMLYVLMRGFVTGFVIGFLAAELGLRGVLLGLAGHLPQSMIEVPAIILTGAAAFGFATMVIESWRERHHLVHFYPYLGDYTRRLLVISGTLAVAAVVEGYVSTPLVALAARLLQGL